MSSLLVLPGRRGEEFLENGQVDLALILDDVAQAALWKACPRPQPLAGLIVVEILGTRRRPRLASRREVSIRRRPTPASSSTSAYCRSWASVSYEQRPGPR